ncbi:MAG: branched-chain amino acid ABC transporter permease [Rhodobacterales bacterium]|nr:MAG: branched-chain amino acid ABC transporter permease [Rhodobacterales bacterium]
MSVNWKNIGLFGIFAAMIVGTGMIQSWDSALGILNMCLISAIMALGVNMQWGYAGLFNVGIMGFVALGGLAPVLIAMPPVGEAWAAGGARVFAGLFFGAFVMVLAALAWSFGPKGRMRGVILLAILIVGFVIYRQILDPAVESIEAINPSQTGYLGGLGLPVILAWPVGGLLAAGAAWAIGKTALGLRSDYLAIATLGISEIIIAVLKNEDWLSRGVKNVNNIPSPVSDPIELQQSESVVAWANTFGIDPVSFSTILVKLSYGVLFTAVLLLLIWMSQMALNSPWGRLMRAIRDNEIAAEAMGKDVTKRHLQVFILGSAVIGIAGAMMVTLDGLMVPTGYNPLRYTFLIWVMVIVGGSGNNWGAVLGGFIIWFFWIQVDPISKEVLGFLTAPLADDNSFKQHMLESTAYLKLLTMGVIMLLVLRFSPRGLIPEK